MHICTLKYIGENIEINKYTMNESCEHVWLQKHGVNKLVLGIFAD